MEVLIFSRKEIEEELKKGLQSNVSIISYCDIDLPPVDFSNTKAERIICKVNDIYYDDLADEGYTYEDFFLKHLLLQNLLITQLKIIKRLYVNASMEKVEAPDVLLLFFSIMRIVALKFLQISRDFQVS